MLLGLLSRLLCSLLEAFALVGTWWGSEQPTGVLAHPQTRQDWQIVRVKSEAICSAVLLPACSERESGLISFTPIIDNNVKFRNFFSYLSISAK